LSAVRRGDP